MNATERWLLIRRVIERDGSDCHLCGGGVLEGAHPESPVFATLDHLVPRSHGGTNALSNLRLAHRWCNQIRGNRAVRPVQRQLRQAPLVATGRDVVPGATSMRVPGPLNGAAGTPGVNGDDHGRPDLASLCAWHRRLSALPRRRLLARRAARRRRDDAARALASISCGDSGSVSVSPELPLRVWVGPSPRRWTVVAREDDCCELPQAGVVVSTAELLTAIQRAVDSPRPLRVQVRGGAVTLSRRRSRITPWRWAFVISADGAQHVSVSARHLQDRVMGAAACQASDEIAAYRPLTPTAR